MRANGRCRLYPQHARHCHGVSVGRRVLFAPLSVFPLSCSCSLHLKDFCCVFWCVCALSFGRSRSPCLVHFVPPFCLAVPPLPSATRGPSTRGRPHGSRSRSPQRSDECTALLEAGEVMGEAGAGAGVGAEVLRGRGIAVARGDVGAAGDHREEDPAPWKASSQAVGTERRKEGLELEEGICIPFAALYDSFGA